MAYRRRPRRRATRRTRKGNMRNSMLGAGIRRRLLGSGRPIFTETILVSPLVSNTLGNFSCTMAGLPQINAYTALYRQYRILKLQVLLFPEQTMGESLMDEATPPGFITSGVGRFVYAINDMPGLPVPANEQSVLNENGCRIVSTNKPFRITCRPQPDVEVSNSGLDNAYLPIALRGKYLDINYGQTVPHTGISYAYSAPTPQTIQVYYKITFQLKEPK